MAMAIHRLPLLAGHGHLAIATTAAVVTAGYGYGHKDARRPFLDSVAERVLPDLQFSTSILTKLAFAWKVDGDGFGCCEIPVA